MVAGGSFGVLSEGATHRVLTGEAYGIFNSDPSWPTGFSPHPAPVAGGFDLRNTAIQAGAIAGLGLYPLGNASGR